MDPVMAPGGTLGPVNTTVTGGSTDSLDHYGPRHHISVTTMATGGDPESGHPCGP